MSSTSCFVSATPQMYPTWHGEERGARGPLARGPRGVGLEPEQALLLARGPALEAGRRALLRRSRRRRPARRARPADAAQALRRRRRGRGLLPEARPRIAPGLGARGD